MANTNSDIEAIFKKIEITSGVTAMDLETADLLIYVADRKNIQTIKKILYHLSLREDVYHKPHMKNYLIKALRNQKIEQKSK